MTSVLLLKRDRAGGIIYVITLVLGGAFLLIGILLFNTFRFTGQPSGASAVKYINVNTAAVVERLATAIRFKTISNQDPKKRDDRPYFALHTYLEQAFPFVHATLSKQRVSELSLLYK